MAGVVGEFQFNGGIAHGRPGGVECLSRELHALVRTDALFGLNHQPFACVFGSQELHLALNEGVKLLVALGLGKIAHAPTPQAFSNAQDLLGAAGSVPQPPKRIVGFDIPKLPVGEG